MQIDYRDGRPIYEQIVDYYRRLIVTGVLLPEEQMPSVRALAMELSTNPNTVQRAYQELERQGCLYSVKGRGSFVRNTGGQKEKKTEELREKIGDVLREAEGYGIGREELLQPFLKEGAAAKTDSAAVGGQAGTPGTPEVKSPATPSGGNATEERTASSTAASFTDKRDSGGEKND